MTSPNDIAIVICTRERPALLAGALTAVRANLPDGAQVLVVDSASTTGATLDAARAAGFPAVRTDVKGLSIARNLGLRAASRPIVLFTDDDCEPAAGWVEAIAAAFGEDDRIGAVTGRLRDRAAVTDPPARRRLRRVRDGLDAGHGAVMAFRRELVVALGGFDEVLGAGRWAAGAEDLDMFCRVLESGHEIVVEPAACVDHVFTREDPEFVELNTGYGRGLGAMAAKWLRRRPVHGVVLLAVMLARALRRAARGPRGSRRRSGAVALLRGLGSGLVAHLRVPRAGARFVDANPPDRIVLTPEPGTA